MQAEQTYRYPRSPHSPATRGAALRTTEDKTAGVEKGFYTDVLHNDFGNTNADSPQKGTQTQNYQGGTPVFGFKRSDDDADIRAAETTRLSRHNRQNLKNRFQLRDGRTR